MLSAHEKFLQTVRAMMHTIDGKLAQLDALQIETESLVRMFVRVHGGGRGGGSNRGPAALERT